MGIIRTIAIVILSLSFTVFVALFGRLPLFRKTPIGFLHRILLIHIPIGLVGLDRILTGGRISHGLQRTGHYLMEESHPLVLVFYIALLAVSEFLFVPRAWPLVATGHQITMLALSSLPFLFLYLSTTTSSNINSENHQRAMLAYPYDYALFHPGVFCRTCNLPKPARSKHCSLCKACIQKQDHHCIWIKNCVGRNNYVWFLLLLVATSMLLLYGACLGYSVLYSVLQDRYVPPSLTRGSLTAKKWSTRLSWSQYFDAWTWAVATKWQIGAVTLLCAMSFPLSTGFFVYHVYLIWAGMTTNESSKWADWREDIDDGLVYRASLAELRKEFKAPPAHLEPEASWPTRSRWWVLLTTNGQQPTQRRRTSQGEAREGERNLRHEDTGVPDLRWEKVRGMAELENIYDLGMRDNVRDALFNHG